MPASHFYYVYILRDATTGMHHYTGVTHDLQERLATHNAGHVPHTSKFTPWEIHSAIAVQTEQQVRQIIFPEPPKWGGSRRGYLMKISINNMHSFLPPLPGFG